MLSNCWFFTKRAAAKAEIKHHNTERAHEMNSEYANKRVKEPAIKINNLDKELSDFEKAMIIINDLNKEPSAFDKAMIKINNLDKEPSDFEKAMIIIDGLADHHLKNKRNVK